MTQSLILNPAHSKTLFEPQHGLQLNCFLMEILKNNR